LRSVLGGGRLWWNGGGGLCSAKCFVESGSRTRWWGPFERTPRRMGAGVTEGGDACLVSVGPNRSHMQVQPFASDVCGGDPGQAREGVEGRWCRRGAEGSRAATQWRGRASIVGARGLGGGGGEHGPVGPPGGAGPQPGPVGQVKGRDGHPSEQTRGSSMAAVCVTSKIGILTSWGWALVGWDTPGSGSPFATPTAAVSGSGWAVSGGRIRATAVLALQQGIGIRKGRGREGKGTQGEVTAGGRPVSRPFVRTNSGNTSPAAGRLEANMDHCLVIHFRCIMVA